MKKIILFAAILFSGFSVVKGQTSPTGTAKLTVNLKPVQSITVNGDVVIDYNNANDYANGKESNSSTSLNVVSAGGFMIRVQAEDLGSGTNKIASSSIAVIATAVANGEGATFDAKGTLAKGVDKKALIQSTKGGVNKKYSVSYKGTGLNEYMQNYNANKNEVYTTTVTYTISAL